MRRLLVSLWLCSLLAGCELVADFDRGKIPTDARDAGGDRDGATPPPPSSDEDAGADEDAG